MHGWISELNSGLVLNPQLERLPADVFLIILSIKVLMYTNRNKTPHKYLYF